MDPVDYWSLWNAYAKLSSEELIKKTVDMHTDRHKWGLSLKGIREAPSIDRESGGLV